MQKMWNVEEIRKIKILKDNKGSATVEALLISNVIIISLVVLINIAFIVYDNQVSDMICSEMDEYIQDTIYKNKENNHAINYEIKADVIKEELNGRINKRLIISDIKDMSVGVYGNYKRIRVTLSNRSSLYKLISKMFTINKDFYIDREVWMW
jgi:hypothetical protein